VACSAHRDADEFPFMFCFLSQILGLVPFSLKETEEPLVLQQDLKGGIDRDLERNVFGITEITKTSAGVRSFGRVSEVFGNQTDCTWSPCKVEDPRVDLGRGRRCRGEQRTRVSRVARL
jgi:hypothetical protein